MSRRDGSPHSWTNPEGEHRPSEKFRAELYQQLQHETHRLAAQRRSRMARSQKMLAAGLAAAVVLAALVSLFSGPGTNPRAGPVVTVPGASLGRAMAQTPTRRRLAESLDEISSLLHRHRYAKAARACERVLQEHRHTEIMDQFLYLHSTALAELGRTQEAGQLLEQLIADYPYSRWAEDAVKLLGRADPDAAKRLAISDEPGIDLEESAEEALKGFAGTVWQLEALDRLVRHSPNHPKSPDAVLMLGIFMAEKRDLVGAGRMYGQILSRWPESAAALDAHAKLVESYRRRKLLDRAAEECYAMLQKYPDNWVTAESILWLGNHCYGLRKFRKAAHWYAELVERFPSYALVENVHFRIGQCYGREKNFRRSALTFEEFAKEYPESVLRSKALACGGDAYLKAEDPERALELFRTCASQYPNTIEAHHARSILAQADVSALDFVGSTL